MPSEPRFSSDRIRTQSADLVERPSVVIAGELVQVNAEPEVDRRLVLDGSPRHPLMLADLNSDAAASQHPSASA